MDTPLNASANSAGAVFSNNVFEIPRFQREYSWEDGQIEEFWTDLKESLELARLIHEGNFASAIGRA